jgi:hypothetical protein
LARRGVAVANDERRDQLGESLGLVLGDERAAVLDLLQARAGDHCGEARGEAQREHQVVGRPREQRRQWLLVQALCCGQRVALVDRLQRRDHVGADRALAQRRDPRGGELVG